MIVVLAGAAVVVLVLIVVLARGRRAPDGVASFQRQIDALSPEARRPVVKRLEDVANRDDPGSEPSDTEPDTEPDTGRDPRAGGPRAGGLDGA